MMREWFNTWFDRLPPVIRNIAGVIFFFGIIAFVGALCRAIPTRNEVVSRPFQTIIADAVADCISSQEQLRSFPMDHFDPGSPLPGRILLLEVPTGEIPTEFMSLNQEIRASDASSVGTLACFETYYEVVGSYSNMYAAKRVCRKIWLVDYISKEILGLNHYCGGSPPSIKLGGGPGFGRAPVSETREWLEQFSLE
jgi:hypothetical protein